MRWHLFLPMAVLTTFACSDKNPVNPTDGTGTAVIQCILEQAKPALTEELKPTTKADISFYESQDTLFVEPFVKQLLTVNGKKISGNVKVKEGSGYRADLFCYDKDNTVTHSGTASSITITAGQQTKVTILLKPAIPEAPTAAGPTSAVTTGAAYSISWDEVSRAKFYTIEEATNNSFNNATSQTIAGLSTSFTKNTAQTYYYRVRANNTTGSSGCSNTVAVTVASIQVTLTIGVNNASWGTTNPASGSYTHTKDTVVTITATPASGYRFVSWTGSVADTGKSSTTVIVTGNITVTANFEKIPPTPYTLTMAVNTTGWGTTNPSVGAHTYDEGTVVTVTATPASGCQFVNWSGNVADATSATTTVTMSGDRTVTANFIRVYTLTMVASPSNGGTTNPAVGLNTYDSGTTVTITTTPVTGYRFVSWTGSVANASSATTTITMSANQTVTANFVRVYTLTMAVNTTGWGTTNPAAGAHTYDEGSVVTVTATPASGYFFVSWTGSVADTTSATTTVTMSGDRTVTANFEKIPVQTTDIEMVSIPAGSFQMGSNVEKPIHTVILSAFEIGTCEVTQGQYQAVMGYNPSNSYGVGDTYPVYFVNWWDAIKFCNALSAKAGLEKCYNESTGECDFTKNGFRLPTEAEWEYACRAGTTTDYYTGNSESALDSAGWYSINSSSKAHPVGQKTPNAWGLYDLHGNVWEWCNDWYGIYPSGSVNNPSGDQIGSWRMIRGGSWGSYVVYCRSDNRDSRYPDDRLSYLGFRVVRRP